MAKTTPSSKARLEWLANDKSVQSITPKGNMTNPLYEAFASIVSVLPANDGKSVKFAHADGSGTELVLPDLLATRAGLNFFSSFRTGEYEYINADFACKLPLGAIPAVASRFAYAFDSFDGKIEDEFGHKVNFPAPAAGNFAAYSFFRGKPVIEQMPEDDCRSKDRPWKDFWKSAYYKHSVASMFFQGYDIVFNLGPDASNMWNTHKDIVLQPDDAIACKFSHDHYVASLQADSSYKRAAQTVVDGVCTLSTDLSEIEWHVRGMDEPILASSVPAGVRIIRYFEKGGLTTVGGGKLGRVWNPKSEYAVGEALESAKYELVLVYPAK